MSLKLRQAGALGEPPGALRPHGLLSGFHGARAGGDGDSQQEGLGMPGFLGSRRLERHPWHLSPAKRGGCRNRQEGRMGGESREVRNVSVVVFIFYTLML